MNNATLTAEHDCSRCYKPLLASEALESRAGLLFHPQCAPKSAKKPKVTT